MDHRTPTEILLTRVVALVLKGACTLLLTLGAIALCATAWRTTEAQPKQKPATSEDRIRTAVLLASEESEPLPIPPLLAPHEASLKKVFGFNQYRLIGEATKVMDGQEERWLVPSQNFWLGAKARKLDADIYRLDIEFFHDKRRLFTAETKVRMGSPLFVKGPAHPRGQIIIAIELDSEP